MADERYIPAPVRRQLRQESGFGCCLCGNPVFQYHHIVEFSVASRHEPSDMMTLCPNHHHEATVGALTEPEQRTAKAGPVNIKAGYADGLLKITSMGVAVHVGSNDLVGRGFKFVVDGEPLLALDEDEAGRLLLSLDLYDKDDRLLLSIYENEWISGDPLPWDIEFGHRWLRLRRKRGEVNLDINAKQEPVVLSGTLRRRGQEFGMRPDMLTFNGVVQNAGVVELGLVGLQIEADTSTGTLRLGPQAPFSQGAIVSWPDRAERLAKCFDALKRLEVESA